MTTCRDHSLSRPSIFSYVAVSVLTLITCLNVCASAADVNVLIVGTTADKGDAYGWADSEPYDVTKVRAELENILAGAGLGNAQVTLHDFKDNGTTGNSLIAEFYRYSYSYAPTASNFWKNLRGEDGTDWDYVVLMGEPYNIEQFPGLYTHGVAECGKEIIKGNAEPVLLMGWPGPGSSATVDTYKEVVYRTGRSLGYKVAPAGLAWQAEGSTYGTSHPTADGAYIAAASIYSRIWNQSATNSTYNPNPTLADRVYQTVTNAVATTQYTGLYRQPSRIFDIMHDPNRIYGYGGPSSSTENALRTMCATVQQENGLDSSAGDGAYPRPNKGVYINRSLLTGDEWLICLKFHHPGNTARSNESYYDYLVTDLSSTIRSVDSTLEGGATNARHLPDYLLWAMFCKDYPDENLIHSSHGSRHWKRVIASFTYTMLTGRCAIGPMPAAAPDTEEYKDWVSARIGYETAWRMGRLQGRAPGFNIMPSGTKRHFVDPVTPETMTVQFVLPPREDVTVNIATDQPWATVTPSVLNFSQGDTTTVHPVTVAVAPSAVTNRGEVFNVTYTTVSDDEVCDGLTETWAYGVNTLSIPKDQHVEVIRDGSIDIELSCVDTNVKQSHTYQIVTQPTNGSVEVTGTFTYTPHPGFIGVDRFQFVSHDGLATSSETGTVYVVVYPGMDYNRNLLYNPSAELTPLADQAWTGTWESVVAPVDAPALTGTRVFQIPSDLTAAESSQDVKLYSYTNHIDGGVQSFVIEGHVDDGAEDDVRLRLEFLDVNDQVLGTPYESATPNSTQWTNISATVLAPAGAKTARVIIKGARLAGGDTKGWLEDLSLTAIQPNNSAPVATDPPVASVCIEIPTSIQLTATDIDRDPLTFRVITPPQHGTITGTDSNGMPIYKSDPNFFGPDSFTFLANDGEYDSNVSTANVTVNPNQAPVITLVKPTLDNIDVTQSGGLLLETIVTDDGGPSNHLDITWSQTDGAVPITFENRKSASTAIDWAPMNPDRYAVRLTARDGELTSSKTITFFVLSDYEQAGNVAPQVDAAGPYNVAIHQPLMLEGDDWFNDNKPDPPGWTTVEWLFHSGPGNAVFSDPSIYRPTVTFDRPGEYVLRLTADDGQIKVYEDATVTVTTNGVDLYTLTVNNGTGDGIYYIEGMEVPVAATTPTNYHFVHWTGDASHVADISNASTTVTMPASDATITAVFAIDTYNVTFDLGTNGTYAGGGALNQVVDHGSAAEAPIVTPDAGYVFAGWDTAFDAVTGDLTVRALCAPDTQYTLTYAATVGGTVSGNSPQAVYQGLDGATVTAVEDAGYNFVDWSDGKTDNPRTDTNVIANITVTANFAADPVVVESQSATPVDATSARLVGMLSDGEAGEAWLCWGDTDGGMGTGNWANVVSIGTVTEGVPFTNLVTGLSTNATYAYRYYAQSPSGTDWSDTTESFSGTREGVLSGWWTPADIDTIAWYDASDAGTVIDNGGTVTQWLAKSGIWDLNAEGDPQTGSRTINGLNVIDCDGSDSLANNWLLIPSPADYSLFLVAAIDNADHGPYDGIMYTAGGGYEIAIQANDASFNGALRANTFSSQTQVLTGGPYEGTTSIWSYDYKPGDTIEVCIDGVTNGTWTGRNRHQTSPMTLALGRRYAGAQTDCALGEALLVPNMTTETRQKIEGYLAHKWGLEGKLAADHPYKASPPWIDGSPILNEPATEVSDSGATLHAELNTPVTDYDVYVYYGTTDGGTNAGSWDTNAYVGSWTNEAATPSYAAGSLTPGTDYYYAFMVSNSSSIAWATPSWTFTTLPSAVPIHTITASPGPGGLIAPNGAVVVSDGDDKAFTITPNTGYSLADVEVDSGSIGITSSYTFTNVTADHSIAATFTINQYTLTYLAGANGSISGVQTQTVDYGTDGAAVTAVGDPGYHFAQWSDGSTANPRTDLVVTGDITVTANFLLNTAPQVSHGSGAVSETETSATLQGVLSSGHFADAWLCWGTADGGTATSAWQNVLSIGRVTEGAAFSNLVTGLSGNVTYFYRCYAENPYGSDWSDEAESFSGIPHAGLGPIATAYVGINIIGAAGPGGTLDPSDVAGYVAQTNWNNMCNSNKNDTLTSVHDASGNLLAGMTVDTSVGAWDDISISTAANEVGPHANLFEGFIEDNDSAAFTPRVRVTGIPWPEYDVYVYLNSENNGNGAVRLNGGGTEYYAQMGTYPAFAGYTVCDDTTSPASAVFNTVIFDDANTATLDIEMSRSGNRIGLSGIQLVSEQMIIANQTPTGIGDSGATLNAALGAVGADYDVYVFYGTSDGGADASAWASSEYVGSWTNASTNVSYVASGLTAGTTYHYTFMASNASTTAWASPSWTFTTPGARDVTANYSVPTDWLASTVAGSTNDYEAAVTNDPDGDGFKTWEEYWCGTDPANGASFLKIDSVEYDGAQITIRWEHARVDAGIPPVTIQGCTDIAGGAWSNLGSRTPVNGTNTWSAATGAQQFYRIAVTNIP